MGKAQPEVNCGRDRWNPSSGTRLTLWTCVVVVPSLATISAGTTVAVVQRVAAASCSACGQNLLLNPGAEAGPGTSSDSVVKVPDWKQTGGFTAAQYSWSGGDISVTSPGPSARGRTNSMEVPPPPPPPGRSSSPSPRARHRPTNSFTSCPGGSAVTATRVTMPPYTRVSRAPTARPSRNPRSGRSPPPSATAPRNCSSAKFRALCRPILGQCWSNSSCSAPAAVTDDGMADNLSLVLSAPAASGTSSTTSLLPQYDCAHDPTGSPVQLSPQTVIVPAATVAATLRSVSADGSTYTFSSRVRGRWPS